MLKKRQNVQKIPLLVKIKKFFSQVSKTPRNINPRILVFVFVTAFIFLVPGRILKINEIKCKDQYGACMSVLSQNLNNIQGKSLSFTKKEVKDILDKDKSVKSYTYRFFLPETVEINVITRKPFCIVSDSADGSHFTLLDNEGVGFGETENSSLPAVFLEKKYDDFSPEDKNKILFGCNVINGIYNQNLLKKINFGNGELIIDFDGGIKVIFPVEGDAKKLAGTINLLISKFMSDEDTENGDKMGLEGKTIDLRFANPVIR